MYNAFYKFWRNPFEITPDPSFLFSTKGHKKALAALCCCLRRRRGIGVLTGEAGTGKTLLICCLLRLLKHSDIGYAYVFNSRLSSLEFLQYVAADFGLDAWSKTKGQVLHELSKYIVARHQQRLTTVIVVDEAHDLSTEALEETRLLTNLETAEEKLVQILLVGHLELDEKLDSLELRQLKQRIAMRSHLEPLDLEETSGYIRHRLHLAGANADGCELFADEAIERIYCHSRGIARLINTVCENALTTAFLRQLSTVPLDIIDEVAFDLRLNVPSPARRTEQNSDPALESDDDPAFTM
jgi:general secretion pathway protein A